MPDLRIIYTPETNHFRLSDTDMCRIYRKPGEPATNQLRNNYKKLKKEITDLPNKVGISTYHFVLKNFMLRDLREIKEYPALKFTTTYTPLDILEAALKLEKEDVTNDVAREYVSRMFDMLLNSPAFDHSSKDASLGPEGWANLSMIPVYEGLFKSMKKGISQVKREEIPPENLKILDKLEKISDKIDDIRPKWELLKGLYLHFLTSFKANKVSRGFPLYYLSKSMYPFLYTVSLEEKIETPESVKYFLNSFEAMKKQGKFDENVKKTEKWFLEQRIDHFAKTKQIDDLDILLKSLPEPKTIITDTYIVDKLPQLKDIDFETIEFTLSEN